MGGDFFAVWIFLEQDYSVGEATEQTIKRGTHAELHEGPKAANCGRWHGCMLVCVTGVGGDTKAAGWMEEEEERRCRQAATHRREIQVAMVDVCVGRGQKSAPPKIFGNPSHPLHISQ